MSPISAIALLLSGLFLCGWIFEHRKRKKMEYSLKDIAHDLRTPLTTLHLYAQILEKSIKEEPRNEETFEHLRSISGEIGKIDDMITALSPKSAPPKVTSTSTSRFVK